MTSLCAQVRPEAETELTRYTHAGVQHEVRHFPAAFQGSGVPENPLNMLTGKPICFLALSYALSLRGDYPGGAECGWCSQVEAGLDDLRAAYAELHQQLDSGGKPPEEKERIAQHVSPFPDSFSTA